MVINIRPYTYAHCEILLTLAGPSLHLKCLLGPLALWPTFISARPSLHLPASINAASSGRISAKFDSSDFYGNLSRNSNVGQIWIKFTSPYVKTYIRCTFAGDVKVFLCNVQYFHVADRVV